MSSDPPVLWMHSKTAAKYGETGFTPQGAVMIIHDAMPEDVESDEPTSETIRALIRTHEAHAIFSAIARRDRRNGSTR